MFTVALIGPDGAGKTTVGRQLAHRLPFPVKYIYMGVSTDSSNVMLPTTRLMHFLKRALGGKPDIAGPPDPNRVKKKPKGLLKRTLAEGRALLRLANRLSEEWYRQALAWSYQRRGHIVLFDRHFFVDYYAYDIAEAGKERDLTQRIHGQMLKRFYPKPDLVIYLDAPAAVLYARKGEGSIEALERRRQDYLQLRNQVAHYAVVDAAQPQEQVVHDVVALIWAHHQSNQQKATRDIHHEAKSTHHSSH
jgi:thymidylate kinase